RRVARRASSAVRALSCAARSSAREVRWPRAPRVHCQETWTSAACRPCPTSLAAVIVVVAKTVSKEFGSDLLQAKLEHGFAHFCFAQFDGREAISPNTPILKEECSI